MRLLILLTLLASPVLAGGNDELVDFASGNEGWSINGITTIVPTGGNPDEHLRYPDPIDTFGISVRNSTSSAFLGDYTSKGEVTLGLDVKVEFISFFGSPAPRELVVILFDDDQVGPSGSSGVWTSLGVLDGNGTPWEHYEAEITDVMSTNLPAGWGGVGDEDPGTFEPILPAGVTWTSVLAGVDRIEFTTFVPGFFFGFTNFDVRVDNISISPLANAWQDLGSALAGVTGEPTLTGTGTLESGTLNQIVLANAALDATCAWFLGFTDVSAPFKGGVLVPDPLLIIVTTTGPTGGLGFQFPTPAGVPSGAELYAQVGIADGAAIFGVALSNAIVGTAP